MSLSLPETRLLIASAAEASQALRNQVAQALRSQGEAGLRLAAEWLAAEREVEVLCKIESELIANGKAPPDNERRQVVSATGKSLTWSTP